MSIRICASPTCCVTFSGGGLMCPRCVERQAAEPEKAKPSKKEKRRARHFRAKPVKADRREFDRGLYLSVFGCEPPEGRR